MKNGAISGSFCLEDSRKELGHSNIGITMNLYVDITKEEKGKEVEKIDKALKIV